MNTTTDHIERRGRKPTQMHKLIDTVKEHLGLRTDKELAELLGFTVLVVTKYRCRWTPVQDEFLLWLHINTGWSFDKLRQLRDES